VLGIQLALTVAMSAVLAAWAMYSTRNVPRACRRADTAVGFTDGHVPVERRRTRRGRRAPGAPPAEWLIHRHPAHTPLRQRAR